MKYQRTAKLKADPFPFDQYMIVFTNDSIEGARNAKDCLVLLQERDTYEAVERVIHITPEGTAKDVSQDMAEAWWLELEPAFIGDGYLECVDATDAPEFIQRNLDLQNRIDDAMQELDESKSNSREIQSRWAE